MLAALLACGSTQCLLYTDPINVKPEVTITEAPASLRRNQKAPFTARAHDPDQDAASLALTWFQGPSCPTTLAEAAAAEPQGTGTRTEIERSDLGDFCVWVMATDQHGASAFDARSSKVENQPPTAELTVVAPQQMMVTAGLDSVELYSLVQLSGTSSHDDDHDDLTYAWTIVLPDFSVAKPDACATPSAAQLCYRMRVPGKHRFELRVRDGLADSAPVALELTARPDAPPCVVSTDPSFDLPTLTRDSRREVSFHVLSVQDDGDAFPPGTSDSTFVWYLREGSTGPFVRQIRGLTDFPIPAGKYHPGDVIQVRFEYRDRIKERALGCPDDGLFCPQAPEATCHQRVGWTVSFL
jgi:hypothetical protein